jgi:hypothetical protein
MGEFSQNLLKLTEFPFSYSLIGLLALIFGQGMNLEEMSFTKIGPILILMGFVATTLSICDPIGALQRYIIKGPKLSKFSFEEKIFGKRFIAEIFPGPYLFAIAYSPDGLQKRHVDLEIVEHWFNETKAFSRRDFTIKEVTFITRTLEHTPDNREESFKGRIRQYFDQHFIDPLLKSYRDFESKNWKDILGPGAVQKYEMRQEIVNLLLSFYNELNKISKSDIDDLCQLLEGLKKQTVKTKWVTAEVDRITALFYFLIVIFVFIVASQVYLDFLPKFSKFFGDIESVRLLIFILSIAGLIAVCYVLRLRINGLRSKSLTVFKYLTTLGAIKMAKEIFKPTQVEIERYLDEEHWPLVEYWVNRLQVEYSELFLHEVKNLPSRSS